MRSHRLMAVAGILAAVALAGLSGCSSSDPVSNWTAGDPTDPGFVAIQDGVNTFIDSTLQYVDNGFSTQGMLISGGVIEPPSFVPINLDSDVVVTTYNANSGWHEIYVTRTALSYGANWRDSVQFRNSDGQYQQNPSNTAEFSYRHHLGIASHDTTVSSFKFDGHSSMEFSGINTNTGTVDGAHDWSFWGKAVTVDSTAWHWLTFNSNINSLAFTKNGSEWIKPPVSGSVTATLEHIYQKGDMAPDTTSWNVNVHFGSSTTVIVTQGDVAWSYTYGE
ncbi:MAG: hypothetical protein AAB305_07290 [Candidatus Zixiibacteriota bacterium]